MTLTVQQGIVSYLSYSYLQKDILESIIQQQLMDHIERNGLFTDSNTDSGGLGSPPLPFSSLAEDILYAFEDKDSVNLIPCDLCQRPLIVSRKRSSLKCWNPMCRWYSSEGDGFLPDQSDTNSINKYRARSQPMVSRRDQS